MVKGSGCARLKPKLPCLMLLHSENKVNKKYAVERCDIGVKKKKKGK